MFWGLQDVSTVTGGLHSQISLALSLVILLALALALVLGVLTYYGGFAQRSLVDRAEM